MSSPQGYAAQTQAVAVAAARKSQVAWREQFVMIDAVAQFCTDKMDLETTVKWGEDKIRAIYAKFA